jgi:L-threonylcarbamoyladenylate synthase
MSFHPDAGAMDLHGLCADPSAAGPICAVDEHSLARAAAYVRAGELVAFPTETVYGLGANALSFSAIERIYVAKGRPRRNPLIVHVTGLAQAQTLVTAFPPLAVRLAERFWPGPLTLVLPRAPHVPEIVSAGLATVALRVPKHDVAQALLRTAGLPIAAPSANRSEQLSPTTAQHVRHSLPDLPLILDGGPCSLGIESTVVDLSQSPPRLLRPGGLPLRALREVIPDLVLPAQTVDELAPMSPGMSHRHYAPKVPLTWLPVDLIHAADCLARLPAPRGLLTHVYDPRLVALAHAIEHLLPQPLCYAADLYAALHRLDTLGLASLAVLPPPTSAEGDWLAVHDRLRRAAAA